MMSFFLILAPIIFMAVAFLAAMVLGYQAGTMHDARQVSISALGLCIFAVLAQAALWVLWGLRAAGVV